jgi:hypothetical protein
MSDLPPPEIRAEGDSHHGSGIEQMVVELAGC